MKKRTAPLFILVLSMALASCATVPKPAEPEPSAAAPHAHASTVVAEEKKAVPALTEGQRLEKSRKLANDSRLLVDQGKNGDGLDFANEALALDPENSEAFIQQGRAYKGLGKQARAIAAFENSVKFTTNIYGSLVELAMLYRDSNDLKKAREYFDQAKALDPSNGWAYREMANMYLWRLDDPANALKDYEVAVARGNNDPWIFNDLVSTCEKLGNKEKAREYCLRAKKCVDAGQGDSWVKGQIAEKVARYL